MYFYLFYYYFLIPFTIVNLINYYIPSWFYYIPLSFYFLLLLHTFYSRNYKLNNKIWLKWFLHREVEDIIK